MEWSSVKINIIIIDVLMLTWGGWGVGGGGGVVVGKASFLSSTTST